jgi:hypothetical protein
MGKFICVLLFGFMDIFRKEIFGLDGYYLLLAVYLAGIVFIPKIIKKHQTEEKDLSFSHELTDKLIMQTVSVNNIRDYDYIKNYVINLNVQDAKAYREYMRDNEPGVDYNIKVERPLSLGGGSVDTFLQLDQFIFVST